MKELIKAQRQYKHNDSSEGFVIAYDEKTTEKIVQELNTKIYLLQERVAKYEAATRRKLDKLSSWY